MCIYIEGTVPGRSGYKLPGVAVGSSESKATAPSVDAEVGTSDSEAAGLADVCAGDGTVGAALGTSETGSVTSAGAEVASMAVGGPVGDGGLPAAGATVIGYALSQAPPV